MRKILQQRSAFFVSDRTGITAETMGLSLISQFDLIEFVRTTLPFIDSITKAERAKERINAAYAADKTLPIVFGTLIAPPIRKIITSAQGHFIDFFGTFIAPLETVLACKSSHSIGKIHAQGNLTTYNQRMEAVNFALNVDDGAQTQKYQQADLILIGVSRSGKTPTCLYLAMQYGIKAANYPLTEEDMQSSDLPKLLAPYTKKLFGLTINPQRLHTIRASRFPHSQYAELRQCQREVRIVEALFAKSSVPYLSATALSIEELSSKLLDITQIQRHFP